jgi:hypothetical protein
VPYGEGSKDTATELCAACHNRPSAAVAKSRIAPAARATVKNKGICHTPWSRDQRAPQPEAPGGSATRKLCRQDYVLLGHPFARDACPGSVVMSRRLFSVAGARCFLRHPGQRLPDHCLLQGNGHCGGRERPARQTPNSEENCAPGTNLGAGDSYLINPTACASAGKSSRNVLGRRSSAALGDDGRGGSRWNTTGRRPPTLWRGP